MKVSNFEFIQETEKRFLNLNFDKISKLKALSPAKADKSNFSDRLEHVIFNRFEPFEIAKERLIGKNDLMSINFLQLGFIASKAICRIHVKNINGGNEGYGTGLLVSNNLVLTNNHVFESADFAVNSFAEFNYQYDQFGEPAETYLFEF